ncbi:MAG TPA: histidine phosphatase family protein [Beijerinckiaceae bacterium]|nr:histidine phosphatase family protein [Beijerinckiaceae bacterium]
MRRSILTIALFACVLILPVSAQSQTPAAPAAQAQASPPAWQPPKRRRIVLMRHGDVSYFDASGQPTANADLVVLSDKGKAQADAAGRYLASIGAAKFDRIMSSHLPRTIETAERVMAAGAIAGTLKQVPELREIRNGSTRSVATPDLPAVLLGIAQPRVPADMKFIGGETIGEMQARVYAAVDTLLQDETWDNALLVLHSVVNSAIVSRVLGGDGAFLGRFESTAGCMHILDTAAKPGDWIVRAYNLCPNGAEYQGERLHTAEKLLIQALKGR